MTRREAWLEARARLADAPRAIVAYQHEQAMRVVVADREAGYIEVELGNYDPFLFIDLMAAHAAGKEWSKAEAEERLKAADKRGRHGTH